MGINIQHYPQALKQGQSNVQTVHITFHIQATLYFPCLCNNKAKTTEFSKLWNVLLGFTE